MGLHVTSDGTPHGTFIQDDDGNVLQGITHLSVEMDAKGPPQVTLELEGAVLDIEARLEGVNWTCPGCGKVHSHVCGLPDQGEPQAEYPTLDGKGWRPGGIAGGTITTSSTGSSDSIIYNPRNPWDDMPPAAGSPVRPR